MKTKFFFNYIKFTKKIYSLNKLFSKSMYMCCDLRVILKDITKEEENEL